MPSLRRGAVPVRLDRQSDRQTRQFGRLSMQPPRTTAPHCRLSSARTHSGLPNPGFPARRSTSRSRQCARHAAPAVPRPNHVPAPTAKGCNRTSRSPDNRKVIPRRQPVKVRVPAVTATQPQGQGNPATCRPKGARPCRTSARSTPRPAVTMARMDRLFGVTMGNRASASRSAPI